MRTIGVNEGWMTDAHGGAPRSDVRELAFQDGFFAGGHGVLSS